jgi:hypothetical protein
MKFVSSLKPRLIYVFRINDEAHKGCLKVGQTTAPDDVDITSTPPDSRPLNQAARKRINEYTQTAAISYELLYTELSVYSRGGEIRAFSDHEVHQVLRRSGIENKSFGTKKKANEWFMTDLETVKLAITAVKHERNALGTGEVSHHRNPIVFRPEQQEAIDKTKKRFKKGTRMLWNAKMRFGKTLSALQVVKEMKYSRTLILTHRPVVDSGWHEDFGKIFTDGSGVYYGSKTNGQRFETLEKMHQEEGAKYLYFASMQDLRGSERTGGNFNKNDELFDVDWDLIIIDEAHEGTQTELGINVLNALKKTDTRVLELSGTPFNLIEDFEENEVFTWDYVMEQQAKYDWEQNHIGEPNPYAGLPRMNIFTYDLGKLIDRYVDEDVAFNFREFFRVNEKGHFVHEKDVSSFLNLICKEDEESQYPYSTKAYRDNFRHSLWMLPGVKEARALSALLKKHSVFGQFEIVNVAGDGDEEEDKAEALSKVKDAIGDAPHESYTITLSCGKLTTGVSVPAWTAVFMLSGSQNTSAMGYMQTIFRVQTPAIINGRVKEECFVFDFAPDRTLKVIAEAAKVSAKAGKTTDTDREIMSDFINFCPVIAYDGSRMSSYDVDGMLAQLKKVYVERVVKNGFEDGYLYNNDELMKLGDVELEEFNELKKIIGNSKASAKTGDIDINNQGFSDEDHAKMEEAKKKRQQQKPLSEEEERLLEEERKKKKNRDTAISILRGISIRMPLLIYGADIKNEDKELTIDNFSQLVDSKSWKEFMPKDVTKRVFRGFKKYYEPDIFRAAGKRIRSMARAADKLSIEERIERITQIFGNFRNPDKETVLTPWRVVNMHMGDCLGGYVFFNEDYNQSIEQPRIVEHGDVTREVFAPDTRILEINSKSGLYPLYMAYGVYRSRLAQTGSEAAQAALGPEQQQRIWDQVLEENIFVICKTEMAKYITQRTLAGFRQAKVNTHHFKDLVKQITEKPDRFVKKIRKGKTYWKINQDNDMKFNAIVGNPPYQEMDGGNSESAKPVYHNFVQIAKKAKPDYISMIMPARWYSGGKGLDSFRESMLNDKRMSLLFDFPNSNDCFTNVDIAGGLCYFLWDHNHYGDCSISNKINGETVSAIRPLDEFEILIRDNKSIPIIYKVLDWNKDKPTLANRVSSSKPFGIRGFYPPKKQGIPCYFTQRI